MQKQIEKRIAFINHSFVAEQVVKKAVLFINMGSPKSPTWFRTMLYLFSLFFDKRILSVSFPLRIFFAACLAPFRALFIKKRYKNVWLENESPLSYHTRAFSTALQKQLAKSHKVLSCMRYGDSSIQEVLSQIQQEGIQDLILFPLYPQYTSSVTGSSLEKIVGSLSHWKHIPSLRVISSFWKEEFYLSSLSSLIHEREQEKGPFDHILFSFHALPLGEESDRYVEECRLIAGALTVSPWTLAFQSRTSWGRWTGPIIEDVIIALLKEGKKRVLLVSPSFVVDCLETLYDLQKLRETFLSQGGECCDILPCLNEYPLWVTKVAEFLKSEGR